MSERPRPISPVVEWGLAALSAFWFVALPLVALGVTVLAPTHPTGGWDQAGFALAVCGLQLGGSLVATALGKLIPGRDRLFVVGLTLSLAAFWSLLQVLTSTIPGSALLQLVLGIPYIVAVGGLLVSRINRCSLREGLTMIGLTRPGSMGWGLAASALVVWPWLLVGALGDSAQSASLTFESVVNGLLTEALWRGLALALLLHVIRRRWVAGILGALFYIGYEIALVAIGRGEFGLWEAGSALVVGLLTSELWARPGRRQEGIWGAVLFHIIYQSFPLLFSDSRMEMELAHLAARLYMLAATLVVAVLLFASRKLSAFLAARRKPSPGQEPLVPLSPRVSRLPVVTAIVLWSLALPLYATYGSPGFTNDGYLIILREQADPALAADITTREGRLVFLHALLVETAERSQADLRAALDEMGIAYRPYYLVNMIRIDNTQRGMDLVAERSDVAQVIRNPNVRQYPVYWQVPYVDPSTAVPKTPWGVDRIKAELVWELGFTGEGVVVGAQDTGYEWEHPALLDSYRGWDGRHADHDGNWHDAWDDTAAPSDDDKHGTHTLGTAVGNAVGVAPDAQWIGCRNMRHGLGNPGSYVECMEFFLAPYPVGGDPFQDGDPLLAPHVINNSWGCPPMEGCIGSEPIHTAVEVLRAAGIMMVVSAGNDGPDCGSVWLPASEDAVFSVGASDQNSNLVDYSSRGPTPTGLVKPDVLAPGVDIRSSIPGALYADSEGTSMAGPHVTGLVALIWSANPALIGHVDLTEDIIRDTAAPARQPYVANVCGPSGLPNNAYGYGIVNALAAVRTALQLEPE